jgi:hypothetical protein
VGVIASELRCSIRRRTAAALAAVVALLAAPTGASARERQPNAAAIVSIASDGESIPTIRTARGVTTMLSMPEEACEAICGDLYDSQTGTGGFVIQRSGRDLFLKPLRAAGETNLFVKTERATYAFELVVVAPAQAMRIVRVEPAAADRREAEGERLARDRTSLEADRAAFERERAASAAELAHRCEDFDREATARAETLARRWIADRVREGIGVVPVARRAARGRDVEVTFGDALVTIGGRSYLGCTIRNRGSQPVVVARAELSGARTTLDEVVPPGMVSTVVVECEGAPSKDAVVRLVDPSGTELVSARPLR